VDLDEARVVLGVGPEDEWGTVQREYRRLIRAAHPDLAGPAGTRHAARLNEAYAVVARAHRSRLAGEPPSGATRAQPRGEPGTATGSSGRSGLVAPGVRLGEPADGAETLLFEAPPDQAFMRLLDASHALGEVSYVDRSSAIFEVIVPHDGETCSLLLTIEPHGHGAVAYCTLESLERVASPSARSTAHKLATALRST
jgi:hypothetical protein